MSEEEIIKVVENVANGLKFTQEFQQDEMYKIEIQAIHGLLNLYQKEKEKNKISKGITRDSIKDVIATEFISKDKIREIIYPSPDNYIPVEVQMSEMYRKIEKLLKEN